MATGRHTVEGIAITVVGGCRLSGQRHRHAGDRLGEAIACHYLGYACAAQGEHRQAVAHYRQALAIYEALGGNEQRSENTCRYLEESLQVNAG